MSVDADNLNACRRFQSYYDESLCRHVGIRAPEPKAGEDINHFRARSLNLFKRTFLPPVHDYHVGYHQLARADMAAFNNFEKQMLPACRTEAFNPAHVPRGELRAIEERDGYGNVTARKFIGQDSFMLLPNFGTPIKMKGGYRPGRRAVIRTPDRNPAWFR